MSAPTADDSPTAPRFGAWFWLILLLGLALRALDLADPWSGQEFKSAFGTYTTGLFARNFLEHGLFESGGMPYYWRVELADGEVLRHWYTHHPAFYAVLSGASLELFGPHAWAVKLPWLGVSILSMFAVHGLARALAGRRTALFAHLVYAVAPLAAWYATLPYTDAAVIALFCVAAVGHRRWLEHRRTRDLALAAAALFTGGLFDWPIAFLLPGLGLHALWLAARERRLAPALAIGAYTAAIALAIGVHRLHMLAVLPPEEAARDTSRTLGWVTRLTTPLDQFLGAQWDYAAKYLTLPLIALVAVGAVLLARSRGLAAHARGVGFALALPGPIYIALFPARSVNHDFFLFMSLPFVALAAGLVLERATRPGRAPAARALGLAATVGVAGFCALRTAELWTSTRSDALARAVAQPELAEILEDPRAVVFVAGGKGLNLPFYSRAPVIRAIEPTGIDDPERLEGLREAVVERLEPDRRAVFLLDAPSAVAFPKLRAHLLEQAPFELVKGVPGYEFAVFDLRARDDG